MQYTPLLPIFCESKCRSNSEHEQTFYYQAGKVLSLLGGKEGPLSVLEWGPAPSWERQTPSALRTRSTDFALGSQKPCAACRVLGLPLPTSYSAEARNQATSLLSHRVPSEPTSQASQQGR